jgi:Terminase DNA packaging enzyme
MNNSVDNPLASALGVILAADQAKSDVELKRTLAATLPDEEKANNDANFARENLYNLINQSNVSIVEIMKIAKESMSARHYEVLALLLQTNAKMTEQMVKINADKQLIQNNAINLERNRGGATGGPGSNVHIQNAVFVGTTKELLTMVKSTQDQQAIDVELRELEDDKNDTDNTTR